MNSLVTKLLVGLAGLTLASAPLAASAQNWDNGHGNHGAAASHDNRAGNHGGFQRGSANYRVSYGRPQHQQHYANGYYGVAPGGFSGYYWNGGWYHHRRWNGGVWIYF